MYVLWFCKPLDIDEPILVKVPDETLALMLVQNYKFGMPPYGNFVPPRGFHPARLSGRRFGVWPTSSASESFLMFNPRMPNAPTVSDDPHGPMAVTSPSNNDPTAESHSEPATIELTEPSVEVAPLDRASDTYIPAVKDSGSSNICYGFSSVPPLGINIHYTISTGQFLSGGVGPNAYLLGSWTDNWDYLSRPDSPEPDEVKQVPKSLRKKLPLAHVDCSTIKHCTFLTFYLSKKDYWRWQLAGTALRKDSELAAIPQISSADHPVTSPENLVTPDRSTFIDFSNSGGSARGAYFVTASQLIDLPGHFSDELRDSHNRTPNNFQQHALIMHCLIQTVLEAEELELGSTSAVIMLPGLLYGALHLTLWNGSFPTEVERLLWRISSLLLITVPILAVLLLALRAACLRLSIFLIPQNKDPIGGTTDAQQVARNLPVGPDEVSKARIPNHMEPQPAFSVRYPVLPEALFYLAVLIMASYVFARVFIIVESFISLRHVPVGVYSDVGWSKYIPHF
ncbi:MAG: hypothetical protein Q9181_007952 [Wetmoreana brouardii]